MTSSSPPTREPRDRITDIPPDWRRLLPDSALIRHGKLALAGVDLIELTREFGTPLYVYDEMTLRQSARRARRALPGVRVSFAAKACSSPAILRVFEEEGLDLDVVSLGELTSAKRSGFPPQRLHLHGNAKSDAELHAAIDDGLRATVVDNVEEMRRLATLTENRGKAVPVMLRIALSLEAETHPYLQTTGHATKFGLRPGSGDWHETVDLLRRSRMLNFAGLHCHPGSQIADADIYRRTRDQLTMLADDLANGGLVSEEVGVGGGWSVAYRIGDPVLAPEDVARVLLGPGDSGGPRLAVEPGRALVARAALALYEVRSVKEIEGRSIVAVDGGMGDNPRPALYRAGYSALSCGRPFESGPMPSDVVGRYCESGDVLARDVNLPGVEAGEIICIPVSGAYQLAMASAYNLVPPPAVVMVADGSPRLITRRSSIDDLLSREIL